MSHWSYNRTEPEQRTVQASVVRLDMRFLDSAVLNDQRISL